MRSIFLIFAIAVLVTLSGCDETQEPSAPDTLLVLTFNADYPTDAEEVWVILHDANGVGVEARQASKGERLVFENAQKTNDKFSVTIATIKDGSPQNFDLTTYHSLDPGQAWTFSKPETYVAPTQTGEFSFTLQDPPSGSVVRVANKFSFTEHILFSEETMFAPIYDEASSQLISVFSPGQTPKYYMYDEVTKGGSYELPMSSLKNYETVIDVNLGRKMSAIGTVKASDGNTQSEDGFTVYQSITSDDESSMKLGYVDAFDLYQTTITGSFVENNKAYVVGFEGGRKTSLITFPVFPQITQKSTDVENFEFESPSSTRMRSSFWNYVTPASTATWTVHSPQLSHKLTLPAEFEAEYPALQVKGFGYAGSKVYVLASYGSFIDWSFNSGELGDRFYVSSTDF